ncbi:MAG TPA: NAD-dependent epimerase/dehydratase family protein [Myxococcales bacterium]|jgi:UDP-glucuronate 4-epimerase|nr:NAD-dependent epimerase/dehydratase family protein [Myxococcales bacterium]
MKRILVTGGAGFIGSHLVKALIDRGDEVTIVDNFDPFYPERLKRRGLDPRARLEQEDIRDQEAMHRVFGEAKPEVVVHLAALAGVRPSLERPGAYMDVNVRGTACVLEAARAAGTRRFVLGSSSSVYGAHAQAPFRESARIDSPESPYAASKVASEVLAHTFHNLYGIEVAALRFFTVYGPRQRPDLAIHKFSRRLLAGQPLPFFGDGSTRRDYTWVDDIVAGVVAACDVPLSFDILNLGGAHTTSLAELVALLEEALGVRAVLDRQPAQPGDVPLTSADVSHAGQVLGYAPRTPIRTGVRLFAEWVRGLGYDWT